MEIGESLAKALETHPCYNEEAHRKFARMHLPVAPRCNIQCNYCNRKYDCSNESRPGVTSEVLTPAEAIDKVSEVRKAIPELSVIGIAGPGDALANEETFETLGLLAERFPDLTACISTNGLMLPQRADELHRLGVRFVTVTMNAVDPAIAEKIYGSVIWEGKRLTGGEAAERLLANQLEGIEKAVGLGMLVKVNVVMIPGINAGHIPELVKRVKSLGAYIVNILPLIPVEGTPFENMRAPTAAERREMMDLCEADARMMRHCKQCRADAIGLLGKDRSAEFAGCGKGSAPAPIQTPTLPGERLVAVATEDGKTVSGGFGNTREFRIYATDGDTIRMVRKVPVDTGREMAGESHREHVSGIIASLGAVSAIVVKEIGEGPLAELSARGIRVSLRDGPVADAVLEMGGGC
ncbi:MAG: nitrogenase cofactor biosynthesis protein NifB [Thermoplasmatales archaeon]|nr:nitrogenase cofactor biosynthesis protein NifB [Thermoplasmatales archaeon]